ncbi:MAG: PLP-dependent cysteine synthase family protein [Sphingomonadales bacterium]
MGHNDQIHSSAIETIGDTPLVALDRLVESLGLKGRILAKLEFLNPGSSKKDRIARQIIEDAEADGTLKAGQPVIEMTSGNTGTGLAIVCSIKGYPFHAVISESNSIERVRMMKALGATVYIVAQDPASPKGKMSGIDLKLVELEANRLQKKLGAFRVDQFNHRGSFRAHYLYTGPEIIKQSKGEIAAFLDFAGSGGTFSGVTKALKKYNKNIKCYLIEPEGAAIYKDGIVTEPNHIIQGGGYSIPDLSLIDRSLIEGFLRVSEKDVRFYTKLLAAREGLFVGPSSGANIAAAIELLKSELKGMTIALILNDSGLKYLSTDLWD